MIYVTHKQLAACCRAMALLLLLCASADAQVLSFSTASIPDSIKQDARAVVRVSRTEVDIRDNDRVILTEYRVVTYWSEKDFADRYVVHYTDQFEDLEKMEVRMYDAMGILKGKYNRKDMMSQASGDGLVENYQVHYLQLTPTSFPVTVEKESVIRKKGYYQLPRYTIQTPNYAVEQSSFTIRHPQSLRIESKAYGIDIKPEVTKDGSNAVSTWTVSGLKARKPEPYGGSWRAYFPQVRFVAGRMKFDGFEGNLSTWKDVGLWVNGLVKGLDQFTPEQEAEIKALVKDAKNQREQVQILYQYLQENFRYVSIQLGIGGYRPFPASFTHKRKYGDCKGLSFYLSSCLKLVGVPSYCALIAAGDDHVPVDPAFSVIPFNHEILCVPLANKDTIWLECTSSLTEFGVLGSFTENRYALLLKEEGGVLVRTPPSNPNLNLNAVTTKIVLADDGSGEVASRMQSSGEPRFDQLQMAMMNEDDRKAYYVRELGYTDAEGWKMTFGERHQNPFPTAIDMTLEKVPEFMAGQKMFLKPRLYQIWAVDADLPAQRTRDFYLPVPGVHRDTTAYQLPEGFGPESLPQPVTVKTGFGSFETSYWFDAAQRTLFTAATLRLNKVSVPAEQYEEVKVLVKAVRDESRKKLIVKPL